MSTYRLNYRGTHVYEKYVAIRVKNTDDTWWQRLYNNIVPKSDLVANSKLDKGHIFYIFVSHSTNEHLSICGYKLKMNVTVFIVRYKIGEKLGPYNLFIAIAI